MKLVYALSMVATTTILFSFKCSKEDSHGDKDKKKDLILQPGPGKGQDCLVAYRETDNDQYASANHKLNPDVVAIRWTYDADNAGEGTNRTYIKFTELSEVSPSADIISAHLSLYGVTSGVAAPLGNSYYPGSPYEAFGDNSAWLKRVLADWTDSTITWQNKPATTDNYQVMVPASNAQWNYDAVNIDVTNMVREMVTKQENYGFCLQLKTEQIYRSLLFGSSEATDQSKRPKLVVRYKAKQKH
jgi:hypothetical protein